MSPELLSLLGVLLTTLLGIIPGLWALVRQYRKDTAEAEKTDTEAVQVLSDASKNIVSMYSDIADELKAELADLKKSMKATEDQLSKALADLELASMSNIELNKKVDLLIRDNASLVCRVQELEVGVKELSTQLTELNATPRWREKRKHD